MELLIIFSAVALLAGWLVAILLRRERRSQRTTHEDGRLIEERARARFEDGPADRRALDGMGAYLNAKARHDIKRR